MFGKMHAVQLIHRQTV